MARFLIAMALLGTLAACGSSSAHPAAGPADPACALGRGHTLAASSVARAYSYRGVVYACAGARQYRLGRSDRCLAATAIGPVAVVARLVAYAARSCGVDTSSSQVVVRRLSDGRRLSVYPASSLLVGPESFTSVGSIAVDRPGHVAWIVSVDSIATHRHGVQVLMGARPRIRVLDSSRSVVPGSLRRRGRRLTWRDGKSTRSASLS